MVDLAPPDDAPQQAPGPRPLPLFLELVREAGRHDPELARAALSGLRAYQEATRHPAPPPRPAAAMVEGASLRELGGIGPPLVLVPSLINPLTILDLDPQSSLAAALMPHGRVLLVDWGPAARRPLSLSDHVRLLLQPLLRSMNEPATLVGYCLGGTLALAAASEERVRAVATLAAPWQFNGYPANARAAVARLARDSGPPAQHFGFLPMEVLQSAFWALDPARVVAKYAQFGRLAADSPEARRFVALEDWANAGEPLPLAAAKELVEDLFGDDRSGRGEWFALPRVPALHFTAAADRIVPAESAAPGPRQAVPSGHVGMIVGRRAPEFLHRPLGTWLRSL